MAVEVLNSTISDGHGSVEFSLMSISDVILDSVRLVKISFQS